MSSAIDDGLRRWWEALLKSPVYQCNDQLLALGRPALERILDGIEGKASIDIQQTETQWRDWGDWRTLGVTVFAKSDLGVVLDAVTVRGWSDDRLAYYVGSVPDPRVLPYRSSGLRARSRSTASPPSTTLPAIETRGRSMR